MSGSRGEANFVWRCKNCKRESSASIMGEEARGPLAGEAEGSLVLARSVGLVGSVEGSGSSEISMATTACVVSMPSIFEVLWLFAS